VDAPWGEKIETSRKDGVSKPVVSTRPDSLGTDVDAPWGEKIETSREDNHQIEGEDGVKNSIPYRAAPVWANTSI
jgi:hypothetical protein